MLWLYQLNIRLEAITGISQIYAKVMPKIWTRQIENEEHVSCSRTSISSIRWGLHSQRPHPLQETDEEMLEKVVWIPGKVLSSYAARDVLVRLRVSQVLDRILLPP